MIEILSTPEAQEAVKALVRAQVKAEMQQRGLSTESEILDLRTKEMTASKERDSLVAREQSAAEETGWLRTECGSFNTRLMNKRSLSRGRCRRRRRR